MGWVEDSQTGRMRERVLGKPDLIRELVPRFDRQVRQVLDHETCLKVQRVATCGSGDSHMAGVATEMAFETIARVPMEAHTGIHLGQYTVPWMLPHDVQSTLVIGISASGRVSRTVEAVRLAKERGLLTLSLTANMEGDLAQASDLVFDTSVADPDVPGVRTYLSSLIALYTVALRLAEVREAISQEEGGLWRAAMLHVADVVEATNRRISKRVSSCARDLKDRQSFMFLGSGPNYGTALFGAAKIIEAVGRHAESREVEEWAHEERFGSEMGAPTFLIAPSGLGYRRSDEVGQCIKRTGKYLLAVVEDGEQAISQIADVVLPVVGRVPEALSPLTCSGALEILASDLAQETGEAYMRADSGVLRPEPSLIRASSTYGSLDELCQAQQNNPRG